MADKIRPDIRGAAQTALDVHDGINLSGILHSLNEILASVIWPESRRLGKGTAYVNSHPIVTLFLHKLVSLNGTECFCSECITSYSRATAEVEKIASGLTDETNGTGVQS